MEPAICRYVGEHCYVFVESVQWDANGGPVLQVDVDFVGELFDYAVPSNARRGIYDLASEAFGEPADVDGDERVFILLVDLGNANPDRPDLAGFFDRRVAEHPDPRLRRDTVYLDAATVRRRRYLAGGTLAHEFQHLIHWAHDQDEEAWVEEGLSGYAEELAGYPDADPARGARVSEGSPGEPHQLAEQGRKLRGDLSLHVVPGQKNMERDQSGRWSGSLATASTGSGRFSTAPKGRKDSRGPGNGGLWAITRGRKWTMDTPPSGAGGLCLSWLPACPSSR